MFTLVLRSPVVCFSNLVSSCDECTHADWSQNVYHRHMQPTDKLVMKATMRESFVGRVVCNESRASNCMHTQFSDNNMAHFFVAIFDGESDETLFTFFFFLVLFFSFRFLCFWFVLVSLVHLRSCQIDDVNACWDTRNRLILFYAPKLDSDWNWLRICIIIIGGHFGETISLHVRLENQIYINTKKELKEDS